MCSYGINSVEYWSFNKAWSNQREAHYGFREPSNDDLGESIHESEVKDPAGTLWVADSTLPEVFDDLYVDYAVKKGRSHEDWGVESRHNGGFNALFGEGHVKWLLYGSSQPCQWSIQDDCGTVGGTRKG